MKEVIIIGGGIIGLNASLMLANNNISSLIIEGSDELGGQLSNLYPEKEITDIPNQEPLLAKQYVHHVLNEINKNKLISINRNEKVLDIVSLNEDFEINTTKRKHKAKYIIIATGLGFYEHRKLGVPDEEKYEQIIYALKDINFLRSKSVAIFGGGDSAIDWTNTLSRISKKVYLIHRRTEFRGDIKRLSLNDNIEVLTPYVPFKVIRDGQQFKGIEINEIDRNNSKNILCDCVLVNYGSMPTTQKFGLEMANNGYLVDENYESSLKRVYVIGDAASYNQKIRRIAPGLQEAEKVCNVIVSLIK